MQILLLFFSFFGLLAWFYWKFVRFTEPAHPPITSLLDKTDKRWMLGLSIVYAVISFIHFADTRQYIHPWHGIRQGDQLVLTLSPPAPLRALYYSAGYAKGNVTISAVSVAGNAISLLTKPASQGSPSYFRWNKVNFDERTHVAAITLSITQGPVDITQFAMVDNNNALVSHYNISDNTSNNMGLNALKSATLPKHMDNTWLSGTVFDEIYYATSAYEYLHGMTPGAWVHPQLGIYLIIPGILIFGMSPLGWRIMPDLASIFMVPLLYLFAKRLFKSRRAAIAASILIMAEFMHYTMGRSASLEPFVTFFLILEYYFLYDYADRRVQGTGFNATFKSLLYCALCFGLAISCKWSALYSAPVIFLTLIYCELIHNRSNMLQLLTKVINLALLFLILPLMVYLLVYVPYVLIHHSDSLLPFVYKTQLDMLNFHLHGQLHASHPYASVWWSWPLDLVPLSEYYWQDVKGYMSTSMVIMGNPALCWLTWGVIAFLGYQWLRDRRDHRAAFLFLAIVAQYVPYAFISRISFIYYFYSVTPFLILGVCYLLNQLWQRDNKINAIIAYGYVTLNIILFLLFFPALAGMEVPRSYTVHVLQWIKTWNF